MGESGSSVGSRSGYFATSFGLVLGAIVGGSLGGWLGQADAENDPFGVFLILWAMIGAWAGAACGIGLTLGALRRGSAMATALLFLVFTIPGALVFLPVALWTEPISVLSAGLLTCALLARWVVMSRDSDDPFGQAPGS